MSNASQFFGGQRRVTAIRNSHSTTGSAPNQVQGLGCKTLASGTLGANVLTTALSITGRGCINFCAVQTANTTSKTMRLKLTIDGLVVFDSTSAESAANSNGLIAVGGSSATVNMAVIFQPVFFSSSLLMEIATSVSETNSLNALVNYEVHQ